ncbi:hypothetical protein [Sulfurimonas denitrificans]|nr:hypothetical protein [Sulfurimonas denitrificans]MDD3442548.1 hypothetical protein [Sulfurimonas denitrificans]
MIKKIILIVLGLSLSAYLIYSGFEILNHEEAKPKESVEVK